jgi:KDO2-lipid IV(A) lauroyltransferase
VHLCSFDLALQAVGLKGLSVHALSAEQPGGGYRWQNRMRKQSGVEIIPASTASLRQAIVRLKNGGSVLTGLDRPVAGSKYRPRFFNRPASLPAHHIFLALKASVPVYMFASFIDPRGTYRVTASGPINMRPFEDHTVEMVRNAEAVLEVAEDFIRQAPQQWSMFYPVWPEVLGEVEGLWQISNRMKE